MEGWSGSYIGYTASTRIHYFKNGISLCGRKRQDSGHLHFDKERAGSPKSYDCMFCIKKRKAFK